MPKRYHSFTVEYKISVVEWHQGSGLVVSKTANPFSIDRKCVRDWNAKYEELKRHQATLKRKQESKKEHDGRELLSVQLDDRCLTFCKRGKTLAWQFLTSH